MLIAEFLAAAVWWFIIFAVVFVGILVGKTLLDYLEEKVYGREPEEERRHPGDYR